MISWGSNEIADWVTSHQSPALSSAAFLVVAAAAVAVAVGLAAFFGLVALPRLARLRPPPGVLAAPPDCFLPVLVEALAAGCFLVVCFWVAAFVQAATALVRAAVLSSQRSCADGFAVGPTWALNSSMSENKPAVVTSDCRIRNLASGDWKKWEQNVT